MNLINRYVSEVGKHLPLVMGREDIEKELRSTLEDMLEERAEKEGRAADEAMEIELLKEYGAPQKVAETYNPHPYLIGPRIFPLFLMVLKISIFGVIIGMSVVTIIELITEIASMDHDYIKIILQGMGRILEVSMSAFGYIVVTFVIIERYVPDFKVDFEEEKEWDPTSLTKEPAPHSIKRGELITEIVFTIIGLAFLNWLLQQPIFSDEFRKLIPWIVGLCFAEILLDIYLLRNAVWTAGTYLTKILIEGANMVIVFMILRAPEMLGITAQALAYLPKDSSVEVGTLVDIINVSIWISLIIVLIVQAVEIGKAGYGLWKVRQSSQS
jgi:hypothetical protein